MGYLTDLHIDNCKVKKVIFCEVLVEDEDTTLLSITRCHKSTTRPIVKVHCTCTAVLGAYLIHELSGRLGVSVTIIRIAGPLSRRSFGN